MQIVIGIVQALLIVLIAPLVSGTARWMRAKMHTRRGPSILQDYYDIAKLFKRQDVATADSSFVHRLMPALYLGVMIVLAMGIPMFANVSPIAALGDIILVIYLLALPRFFFSLSAVDSGSAYAGIGGVRELIVGVLVEPAMMLALFTCALCAGTTSVQGMGQAVASLSISSPVGVCLAGIAFFAACYVELGKLPFDLAEAEQELQEGPLSEYSGPSLALAKIAMSMKQVIVVSWFCAIFIPWGAATELTLGAVVLGALVWLVKIAVIFFLCSIFENVVSRVRYKFVGRQTWAVVAFAAFAFVFCALGI
jgi:hydrogenase-4 component C